MRKRKFFQGKRKSSQRGWSSSYGKGMQYPGIGQQDTRRRIRSTRDQRRRKG